MNKVTHFWLYLLPSVALFWSVLFGIGVLYGWTRSLKVSSQISTCDQEYCNLDIDTVDFLEDEVFQKEEYRDLEDQEKLKILDVSKVNRVDPIIMAKLFILKLRQHPSTFLNESELTILAQSLSGYKEISTIWRDNIYYFGPIKIVNVKHSHEGLLQSFVTFRNLNTPEFAVMLSLAVRAEDNKEYSSILNEL